MISTKRISTSWASKFHNKNKSTRRFGLVIELSKRLPKKCQIWKKYVCIHTKKIKFRCIEYEAWMNEFELRARCGIQDEHIQNLPFTVDCVLKHEAIVHLGICWPTLQTLSLRLRLRMTCYGNVLFDWEWHHEHAKQNWRGFKSKPSYEQTAKKNEKPELMWLQTKSKPNYK